MHVMLLLTTANGNVIGDNTSWRDSRGLSCEDYTSLKYCSDGSYGPAWRVDTDQMFSYYADGDGVDAHDACCSCALSSSHSFSRLGCSDRERDSEIWYDVAGVTCEGYTQSNWCEDGDYGKFSMNAVHWRYTQT